MHMAVTRISHYLTFSPLTQEIDTDCDNYDSYSNRSVIRARNSEWDMALEDLVKVRCSAYSMLCLEVQHLCKYGEFGWLEGCGDLSIFICRILAATIVTCQNLYKIVCRSIKC
ncbi:hypothetical protein EDB19DRAFT_317125 [Suillus lakei]|nr:hypothetical protein EDB19DRAFT_317125 [Suillus lakei]